MASDGGRMNAPANNQGMSAGAVDVLAVLRSIAERASEYRWDDRGRSLADPVNLLLLDERDKNAVAAVAELIEALNFAKPEIQQAEFVLRNAGCTETAEHLMHRVDPLFAALARVGGA